MNFGEIMINSAMAQPSRKEQATLTDRVQRSEADLATAKRREAELTAQVI